MQGDLGGTIEGPLLLHVNVRKGGKALGGCRVFPLDFSSLFANRQLTRKQFLQSRQIYWDNGYRYPRIWLFRILDTRIPAEHRASWDIWHTHSRTKYSTAGKMVRAIVVVLHITAVLYAP